MAASGRHCRWRNGSGVKLLDTCARGPELKPQDPHYKNQTSKQETKPVVLCCYIPTTREEERREGDHLWDSMVSQYN